MSPEPSGGLQRLLDWLGADVVPALEALGFPLYVLDTAGVVRWINPAAAEIVGDVVGSRFVDVLAPEAAHRARSEFASKLLRTREKTDFATTVLAADGATVAIEISSVPLVDGSEVVGVFGIGYPSPSRPVDGAPSPALTPRQREVLALLARGRTTLEIAAELGIAEETARNHIRHLLRRLGARSRLSAVLEARRLGIE